MSSAAPASAATTRERLLIEAARLFRSSGYAGTSTRVLAQSLGITKAALYHHVRSKNALLLELCLESVARIDDAVTTALNGQVDSLARLRTAVIAHVVSALENADMHATMLIEMRSLGPEDHEEVRRARAGYETRIRELVEAAQRDHYLRPTLEARWMTLSLLNTLNWSIFWYHPEGSLAPKEIGHILLDVYLDGVAVTTPPHLPTMAPPPTAPPPAKSQLDRVESKLDTLLDTLAPEQPSSADAGRPAGGLAPRA